MKSPLPNLLTEDDEIVTPRYPWLGCLLILLLPAVVSFGVGLYVFAYFGSSLVNRLAATMLAELLFFGLTICGLYIDAHWLEKPSRKNKNTNSSQPPDGPAQEG